MSNQTVSCLSLYLPDRIFHISLELFITYLSSVLSLIYLVYLTTPYQLNNMCKVEGIDDY
jgi:hypothetical protein